MSDERNRARLISEYADDLIARRASERPVTEPGPESDLARMLEVTRELTEIAFEIPPDLTTELLAAVHEEARVKERHREAGALRRSFTAIRALLGVGGHWRLGRPVGVCIAIAITLAVFFARRDATLSASELLTESAKAEAVRLEPPGLVARRAFTIEARDTADHKLLAAQHVELWVNPKARIKARRLFDDRHRLLGGEWTESDGSRVVYERGKPPRKEHSSEARPTTLDAMWRWEPSAEDFSQLVGNVARVTARKTDTGFELSLVEANARLAHVELSLDGEHLPLAQRVVLREGGHVIEVHTRRTVSEVLPEARVANTSFEPEVELLPSSTTTALSTAPREATAPPAAASLLTEQSMDGLELQAWYRLHQLGPCLAEAGQIQRRRAQLDVRVVVTSAACRSEASRSLSSLRSALGVSVELLLNDTAIASRTNQTARSDATASLPKAATDLDSDEALVSMPGYRLVYDFEARQALRDAQGGRDVDAAVKPLIRRLALWSRDRSARRLAWVRELERLSTRWPPTTLKPLGLDAASMWQAMVRDNARMLAEDTDLLVAQLEPALDVSSATDPSPVPALRTLTDVRNAIGELRALVEANDADIRTLFTASRQDERVSPIPSGARLIQALRKASRLAVRLTEPWALEP